MAMEVENRNGFCEWKWILKTEMDSENGNGF